MKAPEILERGAQHMRDRAAERDQPDGERSMLRTVNAFNALTGHALSERDGWLFMVALKAARACNTPTGRPDDYEDGAAYFGLAGECAAPVAYEVRHTGGPFRVAPPAIPNGFEYVAQDANGKWHAYVDEPSPVGGQWVFNQSPSGNGTRFEFLRADAPNPDWASALIARGVPMPASAVEPSVVRCPPGPQMLTVVCAGQTFEVSAVNRFVAQDADGDVYAYSSRPVLGIYQWGTPADCICTRLGRVDESGDWRESLVTLPGA